MSTALAQLPKVLNQRVALQPLSDASLCSEVALSPAFNKPPKNPLAPAPKMPTVVPRAMKAYMSPIDVLSTLGLAMLAPQHVQQGLVSWHWSLLRYGYLVAPAGGHSSFALRPLAGGYRHHHMTALSEAIGVACALSYAQAWLLAVSAPIVPTLHGPIDFDYLLGGAGLALPGRRGGAVVGAPNATRQPDYLFVAEDPATRRLRLLLVECKGTSSGRTHALNQLGSAMHQLQGVAFTGTAARWRADRHAYASVLSKATGRVVMLGVDPPEEGDTWIEPGERRPSESRENSPFEIDEGSRLLIEDVGQLSEQTDTRLDDRALAWAGFGPTADQRQRVSGAPTVLESSVGDVVGAESTFTLPTGEAVRVITGTVRDRLLAAAADDSDEREARRDVFRHRFQSRRQVGGAAAEVLDPDADPERSATSLTTDGSILHISLLR